MLSRLALAIIFIALVAGAPARYVPLRTITNGVVGPFSIVIGRDGALYVGNSPSQSSVVPRENNVFPEHVRVYAPKSSVVKRTIDVGHNADALMLDESQHLYVLEYGNGVDSAAGVSEFMPGSDKILRRIPLEVSGSEAFALDGGGNLYVGNVSASGAGNSFTAGLYRPGETSPSRKIVGRGRALGAMVTDHEGLYVAAYDDDKGYNCVCVYSLASGVILRKVTDGVGHPVGLAFDPSGNLYVANAKPHASVVVYLRGSTKRLRTISTGITDPSALAFDRSGVLYVANAPDGSPASVVAFSPGSTKPALTIAIGIKDPVALAFDRSGDLYVANREMRGEPGEGSVTVYGKLDHADF
jgi:DNA-binding beta-propeller fold protein YncE